MELIKRESLHVELCENNVLKLYKKGWKIHLYKKRILCTFVYNDDLIRKQHECITTFFFHYRKQNTQQTVTTRVIIKERLY